MKCLDSTFLIDVVEDPSETRGVAERLEQGGETLATTVFNAYEVLTGVQSIRDSGQRARLLDHYAKVFARMTVLPLTFADAAKAAEIGGELRRKGVEVGADSLTAAVALRNGCDAVVTRNVSHFDRIRSVTGLAVVTY